MRILKSVMAALAIFGIAAVFMACNVTVYEEVEMEVEVEIELYVTGISITAPFKSGYALNSPFDPAGLEVKIVFEGDAGYGFIDTGYSFLWNDQTIAAGSTAISAAAGLQTVTVYWRGHYDTFDVYVVDFASPLTNQVQWDAAMNFILISGDDREHTVIVGGNFELPGFITPTFGELTDITVTLQGEGTLALAEFHFGSMFYITCYQTLIIDGANLILEGLDDNEYPLILIDGENAFVELRAGIIQNNINTTTNGGGVLVRNGASFLMTDGEIRYNRANAWGGVGISAGGLFTMRGGYIRDNEVALNGGGVTATATAAMPNSRFVMEGGSIINNKATTGWGGVSVLAFSHMTMSGGHIADNTGYIAGGIILWRGSYADEATLTLSGNAEVEYVTLQINNVPLPGGGVGPRGSSIGIKAGWTGSVGHVDLRSMTSVAANIPGWWTNQDIVRGVEGHALTAAYIPRFHLNNFLNNTNDTFPIENRALEVHNGNLRLVIVD